MTLTPKTEAKLLAWAEYEGQEADIVADVLLAVSVHILNSRPRCELSTTYRRTYRMKNFMQVTNDCGVSRKF
jgi:hypothetical protein